MLIVLAVASIAAVEGVYYIVFLEKANEYRCKQDVVVVI